MIVRLTDSDPHPYSVRLDLLLKDWWGQEIEVGQPQTPEEKHRCATTAIYEITGPKALLDLLAKADLGRYVCAHQIAEIIPNGHR